MATCTKSGMNLQLQQWIASEGAWKQAWKTPLPSWVLSSAALLTLVWLHQAARAFVLLASLKSSCALTISTSAYRVCQPQSKHQRIPG